MKKLIFSQKVSVSVNGNVLKAWCENWITLQVLSKLIKNPIFFRNLTEFFLPLKTGDPSSRCRIGLACLRLDMVCKNFVVFSLTHYDNHFKANKSTWMSSWWAPPANCSAVQVLQLSSASALQSKSAPQAHAQLELP